MNKEIFKNKVAVVKKLNHKEFWKWPLEIKLGFGIMFCIAVFAIGNVALTLPLYGDYQDAVAKEDKLKKEYTDKARQSVNMKKYEEQLSEIISASDALLKQLPNRAEVEKLIIDINQSGIGRGLRFELFKPEYEIISDYYAELPIKIEVTGTYEAIGNFASDLSQLSRVVLLKDINMTPSGSSGLIKFKATAQTFRYLDQEEIDKKKSELRAKEKKTKKSSVK
jgi:type IV pilus assembly protein PilO